MFNNTFWARLDSSGSFGRGGVCYWLSLHLKDNISVLLIGCLTAARFYRSYFDDEYEGTLSRAGASLSKSPRTYRLLRRLPVPRTPLPKSCDAFLHPVLWGCVRSHPPPLPALQGQTGFLRRRATCLRRKPHAQPQGEPLCPGWCLPRWGSSLPPARARSSRKGRAAGGGTALVPGGAPLPLRAVWVAWRPRSP